MIERFRQSDALLEFVRIEYFLKFDFLSLVQIIKVFFYSKIVNKISRSINHFGNKKLKQDHTIIKSNQIKSNGVDIYQMFKKIKSKCIKCHLDERVKSNYFSF